MQQQSGGWLPTGFTELEYLESSGTQYIVVSHIFGTNKDIATGRFYIEDSRTSTQVLFGSRHNWKQSAVCVSVGINESGYAQFASQAQPFDATPFYGTELQLRISQEGCELNGTLVAEFQEETFNSEYPYFIFTTMTGSTVDPRKMIGKCYDFSVGRSGKIILNLIPVLDASGTPCMFDKVSRQCFYNAGAGTFGYRVKTAEGGSSTFSLRDPYYTAPSGIYARQSGENALEILADTEEPQGEGWEWFANTGEAYEHFGITQEELLTNNDTDHE